MTTPSLILLASLPTAAVSGLVLKHKRAPYHPVLVTLHKFACLAIVIILGLQGYRLFRTGEATGLDLTLIAVPLLLFLVAFGFGAAATIVPPERVRPLARWHRISAYSAFATAVPNAWIQLSLG